MPTRRPLQLRRRGGPAEDPHQNYDDDLSINRYKEVVHEAVEQEAPALILARLDALEAEIQEGMRELEEMIS